MFYVGKVLVRKTNKGGFPSHCQTGTSPAGECSTSNAWDPNESVINTKLHTMYKSESFSPIDVLQPCVAMLCVYVFLYSVITFTFVFINFTLQFLFISFSVLVFHPLQHICKIHPMLCKVKGTIFFTYVIFRSILFL